MKEDSIIKFGKWCVTRTLVFYFIVAVAGFFFLNHQEALSKAKFQTLNRLLPPPGNIVEFSEGQYPLEDDELKKYLHYYRKVVQYVPPMQTAYALQGFCLYHLGLTQESIQAYHKAIEGDPHFFWDYYNLGLIYFREGNYTKAAEIFEEALTKKPDITIKIILANKVYQQLISRLDQPGEMLLKNIEAGYKNCYHLLVVSKQLSQSKADPSVVAQWDKLAPTIF